MSTGIKNGRVPGAVRDKESPPASVGLRRSLSTVTISSATRFLPDNHPASQRGGPMTASAVQAGGGVGSGRRGTGGGSWQTTLFVLLAAGAVVAVAARTRSKKRRRTMSYVLGPDGKHVDIGGKRKAVHVWTRFWARLNGVIFGRRSSRAVLSICSHIRLRCRWHSQQTGLLRANTQIPQGGEDAAAEAPKLY